MSAAPKFTPGPWEAHEHAESWVRSVTMQNIVCSVDPDLHHKGEQEANRRLIAAAPDLYAALIAVMAESDRKTDAYDAARAAIAKVST